MGLAGIGRQQKVKIADERLRETHRSMKCLEDPGKCLTSLKVLKLFDSIKMSLERRKTIAEMIIDRGKDIFYTPWLLLKTTN